MTAEVAASGIMVRTGTCSRMPMLDCAAEGEINRRAAEDTTGKAIRIHVAFSRGTRPTFPSDTDYRSIANPSIRPA